jgi:hypothetical protein
VEYFWPLGPEPTAAPGIAIATPGTEFDRHPPCDNSWLCADRVCVLFWVKLFTTYYDRVVCAMRVVENACPHALEMSAAIGNRAIVAYARVEPVCECEWYLT